ncbi:MAG: hypothetical protein Kow00106_06120 [Anaerolineae bacterium]
MPGTEARNTRGSQTARQQQYSAVHRAASFLMDSDNITDTGHSIREAGCLDKGRLAPSSCQGSGTVFTAKGTGNAEKNASLRSISGHSPSLFPARCARRLAGGDAPAEHR